MNHVGDIITAQRAEQQMSASSCLNKECLFAALFVPFPDSPCELKICDDVVH